MDKGLIQVYTGDGKGKTTAAMGLVLRAAGRGLRVAVIQFLKGDDSGEIMALAGKFPEIIIIRSSSQRKFSWNMNSSELEVLRHDTLRGFDAAKNIISGGDCDMLVLDEIIAAVNKGFIHADELCGIISSRPPYMEVVLTGRDAPAALLEIADLVTEMKKVKHPYEKGINARTGIER